MERATSGNLVIPHNLLDQSQKKQSIVGFKSPSPLPFHGFSAEQEMLYELTEKVQQDGAKVNIVMTH